MYMTAKKVKKPMKNNISWLTKEALTCILIHNN